MDATLIDFERQHSFLDPANFNQKNYRIDIIGAMLIACTNNAWPKFYTIGKLIVMLT